MTSYYAVTRKSDITDSATPDESDSKTEKLLEAMLSPRGQKVVEDAGYVPVN